MIHYQNKYDTCPFILVLGIFKTLWESQCTKINAAHFIEEHKCYRSQGIESVSWDNNWWGPLYAALNSLWDLTWHVTNWSHSLYHQYSVELHRNHASWLVWPNKVYVTKLRVQITKHAKMLWKLPNKASYFLINYWNVSVTLLYTLLTISLSSERNSGRENIILGSLLLHRNCEWTSHILQNEKLVWIMGRI